MTARLSPFQLSFGAAVENDGVRFRVWAPRVKTLAVRVVGSDKDSIVMRQEPEGIYEVFVPGLAEGADYRYVINGERERPDPVSRYQPYGVHGPSRVMKSFAASAQRTDFQCPRMQDLVLYELHVGTFSAVGTFDGVIEKLQHLRDLGVNVLEIMPIAAFLGPRNWGYDGVHLYAPHAAYGGPDGFRRLIAACHEAQLAVILDVVYNHVGPEGNYLAEYGPYFTDRHHTPWGQAINFDGDDAAHVRRYFIDNARYWLNEFQVDGFRLDAIHGIRDFTSRHILEELVTTVRTDAQAAGRNVLLIAESDLNDPRTIRSKEAGGYGFDAQWSDDFHHALHVRLTGARHGYFADFGGLGALEKALTHGFVYDGSHSVFRGRAHGASALDCPGEKFVVYTQNHNQIAHGSGGKRHSRLLSLAEQKLAAFILLVAPNVPLLFMGQEYGETAPFLCFTSHGDPQMADAVSRGRKAEFAGHFWENDHEDPQAASTFEHSILDWSKLQRSPHLELLRLYHDLVQVRREYACLHNCRKDLVSIERSDVDGYVVMQRDDHDGSSALALLNFTQHVQSLPILAAAGPLWRLALHTSDVRYGGRETDSPPECLDCENGATATVTCPPFAAILYLCGERR